MHKWLSIKWLRVTSLSTRFILRIDVSNLFWIIMKSCFAIMFFFIRGNWKLFISTALITLYLCHMCYIILVTAQRARAHQIILDTKRELTLTSAVITCVLLLSPLLFSVLILVLICMYWFYKNIFLLFCHAFTIKCPNFIIF